MFWFCSNSCWKNAWNKICAALNCTTAMPPSTYSWLVEQLCYSSSYVTRAFMCIKSQVFCPELLKFRFAFRTSQVLPCSCWRDVPYNTSMLMSKTQNPAIQTYCTGEYLPGNDLLVWLVLGFKDRVDTVFTVSLRSTEEVITDYCFHVDRVSVILRVQIMIIYWPSTANEGVRSIWKHCCFSHHALQMCECVTTFLW